MVVVTDEGVFTSSDEGRSWRQREATPSEQLVWPASDVLYRADPGGLIKRSADGGDTWKDTGSPGIGVNDLTADHAGALYASVPGGEVQRSTDRGASWRRHLVLR